MRVSVSGSRHWAKRAGALALGAVLLGTSIVAATALAASPGSLEQIPGTAGCVNESPPGAAAGCEQGRALRTALGVTVSPDGRNAYAVARTSDAIVVMDRDPLTGDLTQKAGVAGCVQNSPVSALCAAGAGLDGPVEVAISPDGENVYVASGASNGVAVFDRDVATGGLTQQAGADGCINETGSDGCATGRSLDFPSALAVSPDGGQLYVAAVNSSGVAVLDRDADGSLSQAAGDAGCITVDGTSGTCIDGHDLSGALDLAISPDGTSVYVAAPSDIGTVAVLDRQPNGDLTQADNPEGCASSVVGAPCQFAEGIDAPTRLALGPDDEHLYVLGPNFSGPNTVGILDRDPDGGLSQPAGSGNCIEDANSAETGCVDVRALDGAAALAVSPDGDSLYVGGSSGIAIFDVLPDGGLNQPNGSAGCLSSTQPSADGCAPARLLSSVQDLAFDPEGGNLYAAAGVSGSGVAVFKRDAPPSCSDLQRAVLNSTPRAIELACSDPNSDPLTYSVVSGPAHGSLGPVDASGSVTYTPNPGYTGPDSFTYRASAAGVDSNVATVSLDVLPAGSDSPFVAFSAAKTTTRYRASLRIPFLSAAPGTAELEVRKGSKRVLQITVEAQRGRNSFLIAKRAARKLKPGRYAMGLSLTDSAARQASDGARLVVKKRKRKG